MIRPLSRCWLLSATVVLGLIVGTVGGCAPGVVGRFSLASQRPHGAVLNGDFQTALYAVEDGDRVVLLLLDGTADRPSSALMIRMFWRPRAGRTPIASTATNAMIHYAIFADAGGDAGDNPAVGEQVGIYSGAGFFYPASKPGGKHLRGALWEASLQLAEATDGFTDLLGRAQLDGRVSATRDDQGVWKLQRQIQERVRERLEGSGRRKDRERSTPRHPTR